MVPLFIATEKFDSSDGQQWSSYVEWAKIPSLIEVISLDKLLCSHLPGQLIDEDWKHIVCEDFRLDYFHDLDYLLKRVNGVARRNILGLHRNPDRHIETPPAAGAFDFIGYDLIEEQTQISALANCGGFPETFSSAELNKFGLVSAFDRACEIRKRLPENKPNEPHAKCEMYAIWRLKEN